MLGADPIEQPILVVGDDETAVRGSHDPGGTTPALAAGILPTGDKIARRNRDSILEVDEQELWRRGWLAVPGAVLGHDEVAAQLGGHPFSVEKSKTKRRRVGLNADGRRRHTGAVSPRLLGDG